MAKDLEKILPESVEPCGALLDSGEPLVWFPSLIERGNLKPAAERAAQSFKSV